MDIILLISASVINSVLGIFVIYKNLKNATNISFGFVAISLGIWAFTWAMAFIVKDMSAKLFWTRMMLAGPSIIPAAFLYFALVFPKSEIKINSIIFILAFILPVVLSLLAVPTELYVKNISIAPWGIDFVPGAGYPVYSIYFSTYLGLAFFWFIIKYIKSEKIDKEKIRYLFLGTFFSALIGLLVNLILPMVGITYLNKLGPMSTVILVAFTAYAITKHHLMDISIVISRLAAEVITILFLGIIYLGLAWAHLTYVSPRVDWFFLTWTIFYGILVGQVYQKIRLFIQTSSDKVFLRGKYDYYKELSDITTQITKTLSMENILATLHRAFYEVLEVSNPRIYLPEDFDKPEIKELLSVKKITFRGDNLIIPCLLEERPIALIVLGKKLSEDPYTEEDLRLLKVLASQTAVAIDHTRTYEQIKKDFEANQKKLFDTERLLARSEKIASLANLIQEYNHEIRTPLGIMSSKIYTLPDDAKEIKDFKELKTYLLKQIERANDILNQTLRLSEPRPRKEIMLNINDVIVSALELYQPIGVNLIKELNPVPPLKGDFEDLKLAFVNLIKNAREAIPEKGNIIISTYPATEEEKPIVCAEVSDTGVGIPKENLERIFEPFFSTHVTKGKGLGLSIVFRIVREHLGRIEVKSEVGKGTTFILRFPAGS